MPSVTRSTKPSINTFFASVPLSGKGVPGVEESRETSTNWSPTAAKAKIQKREFFRHAQQKAKEVTKKAKASSSAPYTLPITGFKTILEGIKYAKAEGGYRPKVVFLNYIPLDYIMEMFGSYSKKDLKKVFEESSVNNFEDHVRSLSVTGVPGTKEGSYHLPVRIAGPAFQIQAAIKVYGLDFARIDAKVNGNIPKMGVFNENNYDIIDQFAYHGDVELSVDGKSRFISANIGHEGWISEHPYGGAYESEVDRRREDSLYHRLLDASGNEMSLSDFHFASLRLSRERGDVLRKNNIFVVNRDKEKNIIGWKLANLGDVAPAKMTSEQFFKSVTRQVLSNRGKTEQTDEGVRQSLSAVLREEKDIFKLHNAKYVTSESDQYKYAVLPAFTITHNKEQFQLEEGDLLIDVYRTKKVGNKTQTDPAYNPEHTITKLNATLSGMVEADELREIVVSLTKQTKEKWANFKAKKTSATESKIKINPEDYFRDDVTESPESQAAEVVGEPGSE